MAARGHDGLQQLADRHGLLIIEDAAQALGSRFRGRLGRHLRVASAISFYPAKVLGCFGDGGAIITNDSGVFERAASLCDFGRNSAGEVIRWGLIPASTTFRRRSCPFQLTRYSKVMHRRRQIATIYQQMLGDAPELKLPPAPDSDPDHFDIYQNYETECERRDDLKQFRSKSARSLCLMKAPRLQTSRKMAAYSDSWAAKRPE